MFSSVCALPSPASAEGCPSLFGWFTGTPAQSDFSCTFTSPVRFMAFADRPWSADQGVQEISRFSCMLFLSARGFLEYDGSNDHSQYVVAVLSSSLPSNNARDPFKWRAENYIQRPRRECGWVRWRPPKSANG